MAARRHLFAVVLLVLGGCDRGDDAVPLDSSVGNTERGELLSYACQACHTLTLGGSHQIGPNLSGVFGRVAGTAPGFDFSAALRDSELVWSPYALDRWLADPAGFMPGTTMAFTGYQSPEDRAALIEFLVAATSP